MQKAENVNQILSKILRDVIAKHPSIAEEVRRELEVAFEIMNGDSVSIPRVNDNYIDQEDFEEVEE